MKLYNVYAYITLRYSNDNPEIGQVRDRTSTDDVELRVIADDVEMAIQKYKAYVDNRYSKADNDDYGDYIQSIAKINIQKVTTVDSVDVL